MKQDQSHPALYIVVYYILIKSLYLLYSYASLFFLSPLYLLYSNWPDTLAIVTGIVGGLTLRFRSRLGYWLTLVTSLLTLYQRLLLLSSNDLSYDVGSRILLDTYLIIAFDLLVILFFIFRRHYFSTSQIINQPLTQSIPESPARAFPTKQVVLVIVGVIVAAISLSSLYQVLTYKTVSYNNRKSGAKILELRYPGKYAAKVVTIGSPSTAKPRQVDDILGTTLQVGESAAGKDQLVIYQRKLSLQSFLSHPWSPYYRQGFMGIRVLEPGEPFYYKTPDELAEKIKTDATAELKARNELALNDHNTIKLRDGYTMETVGSDKVYFFNQNDFAETSYAAIFKQDHLILIRYEGRAEGSQAEAKALLRGLKLNPNYQHISLLSGDEPPHYKPSPRKADCGTDPGPDVARDPGINDTNSKIIHYIDPVDNKEIFSFRCWLGHELGYEAKLASALQGKPEAVGIYAPNTIDDISGSYRDDLNASHFYVYKRGEKNYPSTIDEFITYLKQHPNSNEFPLAEPRSRVINGVTWYFLKGAGEIVAVTFRKNYTLIYQYHYFSGSNVKRSDDELFNDLVLSTVRFIEE